MLPVGFSALVLNASLIGMKGVQAPESTAGSARTKNSRMPNRPLVGLGDCARLTPPAQDRVKAPFAHSADGLFSGGLRPGRRRQAPPAPSGRPAAGPQVRTRRNPQSTHGTAGTS